MSGVTMSGRCQCGSVRYVVSVRAGTLDGDPGLRPTIHIYVGSKAPWCDICDDLPQKPEGLGS